VPSHKHQNRSRELHSLIDSASALPCVGGASGAAGRANRAIARWHSRPQPPRSARPSASASSTRPAPRATELIEIFRGAKSVEAPVFVHARSSGIREPGSGIEPVSELIGAAAISGASVHIVHVNSVCMTDSMECIEMIRGARQRGLDVTTEAYPYTVAMTTINSAYFNPGWREKRGLDYDDLEIPEAGERLTKEKFEAFYAATERRLILIHANPDSIVTWLFEPSVIVASDGVLQHPRARARVRASSRAMCATRSR